MTDGERWREGLSDKQVAEDKNAEYRRLNDISPTQIYYHASERMYRPDYMTVTIVS